MFKRPTRGVRMEFTSNMTRLPGDNKQINITKEEEKTRLYNYA